LGAREEGSGVAAIDRLDSPGNVSLVSLDLTSDISIASCIDTIKQKHGRIDILINNAATSERILDEEMSTREKYAAVFDVNLFGVAALMERATPLLEESTLPRVVMVSSALGSVTLMLGGHMPKQYPAYIISKTALSQQMAVFKSRFPRWKINAVSPPYSSTDLTGDYTGKAEHPNVGATTIVQLCERMGLSDAPCGKFFGSNGEIPW
jgi:NAD(P)-dependent dehydrogenase (short-subunit alcohol dehydrogenase family)